MDFGHKAKQVVWLLTTHTCSHVNFNLILHCSLKDGNILVMDCCGETGVMDFGLYSMDQRCKCNVKLCNVNSKFVEREGTKVSNALAQY